MPEVRWIFFAWAVVAGFMGMYGVRKRKMSFLIISAVMLPVLLFTALWCRIGLSDISLCFCLTAFWVLYGLRKERK
ncbi:hypothetical protein [Murimonas intestini]|uniref:hypothetical protein n=1 Tax=Murimonas intestini TaxID=1337051 RepID=UPI001652941B|nr:hypothetical protein [Murimonas intestini]